MSTAQQKRKEMHHMRGLQWICFIEILFISVLFHVPCLPLVGLWGITQAKLDAMQAKIEGLERVQLKERDLRMTQTAALNVRNCLVDAFSRRS